MNNVDNIVWLIPFLPLLGFLIIGLLRNRLSKGMTSVIGCGVIAASFGLSLYLFTMVLNGQTMIAHYFDFFKTSELTIPFDFKIDQLSSIFLLIITGVGFLIHVYSTSYMHEESPSHFARYFCYLNLFVFSMLLLVMGNNFVIMFIGWEGVGLCSYLLIGYWFKNVNYTSAAKKAFVMNRIGDLGFLLAVFWLIVKVGSVSFDQVFTAATLEKLTSTDITGITLLLFLGATGKSAQIPLYTWLPDAMAGPTPVSALIHAATMVTAGIYMIARSNLLFTTAPVTQAVIAVTGIATMILAASIALKQNDIKKVLAYSTVSQLGYMFVALGVGAYTAAVFHVMTHAFFKALLFLGAGSVIHAMGGEQDLRNMGGLRKNMPFTKLTFLIGCIAIAGIPPLSGFFSKDEILAAAFEHNKILWVVGVAGAMMTAFYMFRLYAMTFMGNFRGTEHQQHHLHESPPAITVPLIVLAFLSVIGGWIGIPEALIHSGHRLEHFLQPVFEGSYKLAGKHSLSHSTEYMLMGISVAVSLAAILFAVSKYSKYQRSSTEEKGLGKILQNKWYVDELYAALIAVPLKKLSAFFDSVVERRGIDAIVNGTGRAVNYGSRQLRWLQNGQIGVYILFMVLGIIGLFIIQMFFVN